MSDMDDAIMPTVSDATVSLGWAEGAGERLALAVPEAAPRPFRKNAGSPRTEAAPPLRRILEAVLFAVDRPVTVGELCYAVPDADRQVIEETLRGIAQEFRESGLGFHLEEIGGGFQLQTHPEAHEYVARFLVGKRRSRLSRAALETMAIIAYRQPITRGEIEDIRGVDSGQVLHTLIERDLITVRGRSQALGRPLLYGSTDEFLRYFGIRSLVDLPSLEELQVLLGENPLEDMEIREALEAEGLATQPE